MTADQKLMSNIYSRLLGAVRQFREPTFVGRIVLEVIAEDGEGYVAEIICPHSVALEPGAIRPLHLQRAS